MSSVTDVRSVTVTDTMAGDVWTAADNPTVVPGPPGPRGPQGPPGTLGTYAEGKKKP